MAEMDDVQLGSIVGGEITDALNHFDSEYTQDRLRALDFYLGEPLGRCGVEGRSAVVATELADTVEAIMPNLKVRVFTTNDKYVRFAPALEARTLRPPSRRPITSAISSRASATATNCCTPSSRMRFCSALA